MTPEPPPASGGPPFPPQRIYLPGLNGVRCIAASAVMIHHIEQGKHALGLSGVYSEDHPLLWRAGELGVTLFFALSGFLITYLLLMEVRTLDTISIRNFYIRRILRIWPLYYLIVFLAWVFLPHFRLFDFPMFRSPFGPDYLPRIAFFLLLCPQLAFPRLFTPTLAGPLWSVGVEEQFYAFWPVLTRAFKGRMVLPCVGVIAGCILLRYEIRHAQHVWKDAASQEVLVYLGNVAAWSRFGCMAIGGMGAWLYLTRRSWVEWLFRWEAQCLTLGLLGLSLATGFRPRWVDQEFYSLLFVLVIMNLSLNPRSLIKTENIVLHYVGEISYGLYVFHWFLIVLVLNVLRRMGGIENPLLRNAFIYLGVVGLSLAVASISYYLFERPFLKMKRSFSAFLSGSPAKTPTEPAPS